MSHTIDYKAYAAMSVPEILDVVDALSKGDPAREHLVTATCFYVAACAREILTDKGVDPDVINSVVYQLTPSDPANQVS